MSGKSTLQKQFQLHYASGSLDHERPSWRPVVYFNIIKAIRMIFDELDYEFASSTSKTSSASTSLSEESTAADLAASISSTAIISEIAELRRQLLPLVAFEDSLASELSGGVHVAGGRTGVYVRSGWQALVTPNRSWPMSDLRNPTSTTIQAVSNLVAKALTERQADVERLWRHPTVKTFVRLRKLRLDESAPLYACHRLGFIDAYISSQLLGSSRPHRRARLLANNRSIRLYISCDTEADGFSDDILNVRLQTLGVKEHSLEISLGGIIYNWLMYDVGGAVSPSYSDLLSHTYIKTLLRSRGAR